jgi:hypothetical protein
MKNKNIKLIGLFKLEVGDVYGVVKNLVLFCGVLGGGTIWCFVTTEYSRKLVITVTSSLIMRNYYHTVLIY